jgi:hypothetical protein
MGFALNELRLEDIPMTRYTQYEVQPKTSTRTLHVTDRHRLILKRLRDGDLRKCSASSLHALEQRGWIHGPLGGYQLTAIGHRIADVCEVTPPGHDLDLDFSNATPKVTW